MINVFIIFFVKTVYPVDVKTLDTSVWFYMCTYCMLMPSPSMDYRGTPRFSGSSEAYASELLENPEDIFPRYL